MTPHMRTIIESEDYRRLAAEIEPDVRRLDEVMEGVQWVISRDPESATVVVANLRVIETYAFTVDHDYVFVFFTIDDEDSCTLRWLAKGSDVTAGNDTTVTTPYAP